MKPFILNFAVPVEDNSYAPLSSGVYNTDIEMRVLTVDDRVQPLIEDHATMAEIGTHSTKIQRDSEDESDDR